MNKIDGWIFYSDFTYKARLKSGYINAFINKAKTEFNLNIEIKNINLFTIISGKVNEIYYDGVLVDNLPKVAILRRNNIFLGRQLELLGVKLYNNVQSMIDARNKLKTHQVLASHGIPTPKTIYKVEKNNYNNISYKEISELLNSKKFIAKYIFGTKGKNVYLIDNEKDFKKIVEYHKGKIICQEFIESSFGEDIRVYVLGGKYKCAAIRRSKGDFRSNLAQGGEAISYEADQKVIKIAEDAARVCNLDICGVDILKGNNADYYVCEVNSIPGFESIKKTKGITDAEILLELIYDKINNGE